MNTTHKTDVAVIGAGPAGLFAVFELGMLGLKAHVIDALDAIGGQCAALYLEKPIYDIPAWPKIAAGELIEQLEQQAAPFHPHYHLDQQVTEVAREENGEFRLLTSRGNIIHCKAVIIAAGAGAFGPNRPPLENLSDYEGKSVFYLVKRRADFADKKIVIAGGGDSAVDWALSLSEIAKRVMVVHRRPKFRAAPDSEAKLNELAKAGIIDLIVPYQLSALEGDKGQLKTVIVEDLDGVKKKLEADILLPFFGLAMTLGPIADWSLGLDKNHIAIDPATCQTSVPGIYAIGDIATYPHKLKLILCGFSEAAMASHAARQFIYPDQNFHFEYSTTKGTPDATPKEKTKEGTKSAAA